MGVYRSSPVQFDFRNSLESAIAELIKDNEKKIKPVEVEPNCFEDIELLAESVLGRIPHSSILDPITPQHEAAIKLQKVYKSFRTRRKLADCAVLIEQSWWKLLDFAELKHSSISFFDIDRHETAISRWSRARTRAAKVGKGLSKNGKAQKLALQHWLEAIDPRHRYGHNLHFYYVKWLNSQSKEPFFYWLDIGEGKDINLVEKCHRLKLQLQCIKYLGPMERKAYEVVIEGGKLVYKQTGQLVNTTKGSKWIFVLSTSKTLYVGKKKKGTFQHSSFLAGGATLAAGRVVAENGVLKAVWPHSGHYKPTPENFQDFISFLRENNVDLNDVKLDSTDDEEEEGLYLKSNASKDDLAEESESDSTSDSIQSVEETSTLEIEKLSTEIDETVQQCYANPTTTKAEEVYEMKEETVLNQSISQRIKLHKEAKSFQLGKQLCCKWSSGAGPRIGCLRDYPLQLQRHALRQVDLSPRSKLDSPSQAESSLSCCNLSCRASLHSKPHSLLVHSLSLSLTPHAYRIVPVALNSLI